ATSKPQIRLDAICAGKAICYHRFRSRRGNRPRCACNKHEKHARRLPRRNPVEGLYMKRTTLLVSALAIRAIATSALAKVPEAQVNRLGNDLTPMGAEKAGEGDIPAWTGGLQTVPSNVSYAPGQKLANPFAGDAIKFTVTGQNMGQYEDILTPGYKAMLQTYPSYKMNVYETRRSCAFPDRFYEANKRNAAVGELVGGGSGVSEAIFGSPFPIANNGLEMIWNHALRYRAFKVVRQFAAAPV